MAVFGNAFQTPFGIAAALLTRFVGAGKLYMYKFDLICLSDSLRPFEVDNIKKKKKKIKQQCFLLGAAQKSFSFSTIIILNIYTYY